MLHEFDRWVQEPFDLRPSSVKETMAALVSHPIGDDETCCDFWVHPDLARRNSGEFRIWVEDQGIWSFFVLEGDELEPNPQVFFESTLDIEAVHGIDASLKTRGHAVASGSFKDLVWQSVAQHICMREEKGKALKSSVCGVGFESRVRLDASFQSFPAKLPTGIQCFYNGQVVCEPSFGAAFLNDEVKLEFIERYRPEIGLEW